MIRAIFYLVQVFALVIGTGWILSQSGRYDITFGDYRIQGETAVLAVLLLVSLLILLMVHRIWLWLARFPSVWRRYRRDIHLIKGHQALTRALSALASGDLRIAHDQSQRAKKLLPDFSAVPSILIATTAERQGKVAEARTALRDLMKTEARDLGIRGLVNAALNEERWEDGLSIARAALAENPRAVMTARLVYDLECQCGAYKAALERQSFLVRRGGLSRENAASDRVILLTALAREEEKSEHHKRALKYARAAFDLDPAFVPAATLLIDLYRGFGKTRAGFRVLHRAFSAMPHPDLIERHEQMAPQAKNLARRLRYHEKFLSLRPDCAEAQMMLARVAESEGMTGEARAYFNMAEKLEPRQGVYRALAGFAARQGQEDLIQSYLIKGMAARPDPIWICRSTGRTFQDWQPVVHPERLFGTIVWACPDDFRGRSEPVSDAHAVPTFLP